MWRTMLNNIKKQLLQSLAWDQVHYQKKNNYYSCSLDTVGDPLSSSSSLAAQLQIFFSPPLVYVLFTLLSCSPQTSLEPPSMRLPLHHLPFSVLSFSSPSPSYLNPPATLPPSLHPPLLLLPGAPCGSCHNRRWNGFICSNVVWAAVWHGTERHFIPVHRASLPHCLQCMCFQTGQSTPLSCAGLHLPPTFNARRVSVKSHPPSLTHTIICNGKLPWPDGSFSPLFTPLHSVFSYHFSPQNLHQPPYLCLSALFLLIL